MNRFTQDRTFNGGGEDHEGSFLAWKMLKEERIEALEHPATSFFTSVFETSQHFIANNFNRALFCLVMRPRAEISTENWDTLKARDRSATNGAYFPSLYSWLRSILVSHGQVSSKMTTVRLCSSIKTRSGLSGVTSIWGGITPGADFMGGPGGPMPPPLFGRGPSSRTPQAPFHYYNFIIISLLFRKSPLEFILS